MFRVVIPSYKRSKICNDKTLTTLNRFGISKDIIDVYVIEEEYELYLNSLNKDFYNRIVIGVKDLAPQREFINQQYPENTWLVCLDDDIDDIDLSLSEFETLTEFIQDAFYKCLEKKCYIWGIYPVWNHFFRLNKEDTDCLNIIVGAFYGIINRPSLESIKLKLTTNSKEDVERSIRYFIEDGITMRFNKIGFKTKYYGSQGGIGTFKERVVHSLSDCQLLLQHFSEYGKIKTRKNGMSEFVLNKIQANTINPKYLTKIDDDDVKDLLEKLEKTKIILNKNKQGRARSFGEHRSFTLGYVQARISRKIDLSYYTKKNMELYNLILELGKKIVPFEFDAIHVNHNVVCPPHKDKNNNGESVIISLGNYEGCNLIIGDKEYDTRLKPLMFDGANITHYNTPLISGNKYSLVFFKGLKKN